MRISQIYDEREIIYSSTAERLNIANDPNEEQRRNLHELFSNVIDPLTKLIGFKATISSCFRSPKLNSAINGSGRSQHCKGQACDLEFIGIDNLEAAGRIRSMSLPFDQLILEFWNPDVPQSGWLHISHVSGASRGQVLTAAKINGRVKYSAGLPIDEHFGK